jgi:hypothetical protein
MCNVLCMIFQHSVTVQRRKWYVRGVCHVMWRFFFTYLVILVGREELMMQQPSGPFLERERCGLSGQGGRVRSDRRISS